MLRYISLRHRHSDESVSVAFIVEIMFILKRTCLQVTVSISLSISLDRAASVTTIIHRYSSKKETNYNVTLLMRAGFYFYTVCILRPRNRKNTWRPEMYDHFPFFIPRLSQPSVMIICRRRAPLKWIPGPSSPLLPSGVFEEFGSDVQKCASDEFVVGHDEGQSRVLSHVATGALGREDVEVLQKRTLVEGIETRDPNRKHKTCLSVGLRCGVCVCVCV